MIELHNAPPVYEKLIHYNEEKHERVYLTVNSFRNTEYLHIRKYYLDFDEEWKPTRNVITMKVDFQNTRRLFEGLVDILSLAESKSVLEEQFKEQLDEIYLP